MFTNTCLFFLSIHLEIHLRWLPTKIHTGWQESKNSIKYQLELLQAMFVHGTGDAGAFSYYT